MPYYLNNPSAGNAKVTINNVALIDVGDYIEIKAFASAGNAGSTWRLAGAQSAWSPSIQMTNDTVSVKFDDGTQTAVTHGQSIAIDEIFTFKLEKISATEWEYFVNDVSAGTTTKDGATFSQLMKLNATSTEALLGGLYYVEMGNSSGVTNRWENTTGTGSTFTDSVGSNDGTLVNFPTDDSQWVSFDGPAATVTTSDTLQPGTEFTLAATNYASAPVSPVTLTDSQGSTITVPVTISGSGPYTAVGTMPTIAEAVTAGTSLLFGDVTIELST